MTCTLSPAMVVQSYQVMDTLRFFYFSFNFISEQ